MTKLDAGLITSLPASNPGSAAVWGSKRINPRPQFCLCLAWSGCPSNNDDDDDDDKRALGPLLKAPKGIATVRGLLFRRGHIPTCRYTMTGESVIEMPVLKRGKNLSSLIAALRPPLLHSAYITYLPISKEKVNDVKELLKYVTLPPDVKFYDTLRVADGEINDEDQFE